MKQIRILIISCFTAGSILTGLSATENLQVYSRPTVSLNGAWQYIVDPYENGYFNYRLQPFDEVDEPWSVGYYGDKQAQSPGDLIEYNFDRSASLQVPGDWNTQDPKLYYYEGTIWYRKKFDAPSLKKDQRVFLYFGAVNYRADVYLNSVKLGVHTGGFTPFFFEITGELNAENNSLVVKVDNKRLREGVPTVNTDWWNYGGITRAVELVVVPQSFIRDYKIGLENHKTKLISGEVYVAHAGENESVQVSIPELGLNTTAPVREDGTAQFTLQGNNVHLWHPEDPKLYRIEIRTQKDVFFDSVGFRTIATDGKQVLLNGEPVFLKGISIHEEYAASGGGRINSAWQAEQLLHWAGELGCNFVRLAHYPHNEDMVRIAERKGILVWSEIPVYWTLTFDKETTFLNARTQLEENILRDRNRANIIIWSLANETPVDDVRTRFITRLAEHARAIDPGRLISAALEKTYLNDSVAVVRDPLAEIVDILAFNQYIGWYDGLPEKCSHVKWEIPYDKPVFVSEFGGGAKYGLHGEKEQRWTEEFQEELYIRSLGMIDQIDGLCGMSPWILADFRSPRRPLPEIQDGFNRKGLVSEKGEKKLAFYILQQYYDGKE
jgi:beta-glucuronidase